MKTCKRCNQIKPLSDFYKHPSMTDGHDSKCKECAKNATKYNYRKNIDYYKEYEKSRATLAHRVKARNDYAKTDAGKERGVYAKRKWQKSNILKRLAHIELGNSIRSGDVIKKYACEQCGADKVRIQGHHDDYCKPLSVRWLCPTCHTEWHRIHGEGLNGTITNFFG
jgi:hypothetical protein